MVGGFLKPLLGFFLLSKSQVALANEQPICAIETWLGYIARTKYHETVTQLSTHLHPCIHARTDIHAYYNVYIATFNKKNPGTLLSLLAFTGQGRPACAVHNVNKDPPFSAFKKCSSAYKRRK